ncbi:Metastasis-associated protein MTA3 [Portunus trituberculatus]|uniref:Metastasis-associated protein MTA3 n=1 Tax=Portunus trituberculatus TaxID=210409 RepID=A0A5B7EM83_PORTR|nr:Metastasis-associated protein MTA3 [Portunus trituberculatus]
MASNMYRVGGALFGGAVWAWEDVGAWDGRRVGVTGDYVYFETSSTSPYQIRRIEELNKFFISLMHNFKHVHFFV